MPYHAWVFIVALGFLSVGELRAQQIGPPATESQPVTEVDSQEAQQDGSQTATQELQPTEETTLAIQGVEAAIRDLVAEQRSTNTQESEERAARDLQAQVDMAWWAAVMSYIAGLSVLVTFAGVLLIKWTLDATREAGGYAEGMLQEAKRATSAAQDTVTETRRIGEAQVRAYLSVNHEVKFSNIEANKRHIMGMTISNTGQTPAYDIGIAGTIFVMQKSFHPGDDFWKEHKFETEGQNAHLPGGTSTSMAGEIFLDQPVAMNIHAGHDNLFAATSIVYTDAFGRKHMTRVLSALIFVPLGGIDEDGNPTPSLRMSHVPRANTHT